MPNTESLRKRASRRSHFWPGAGFALLGHPGLACLGAATIAFMPLMLVGLAIVFIPVFVWLFIASLFVYVVFYLAEQWHCRTISIRVDGEMSILSRFLVPLCGMGYAALVAVLVWCYLHIGVVRIAGPGMTPTLNPSDRVIYKKHVFPEDLKAGHLVFFITSPESAWGKGGDWIVARILAVPEDLLAIEGDHYLVNGKRAAHISPLGAFRPCIDVPQSPDSMEVPAGCYFVVQDNPQKSFDSRVLSWAREGNLIGTRAIMVMGSGFAKEVE